MLVIQISQLRNDGYPVINNLTGLTSLIILAMRFSYILNGIAYSSWKEVPLIIIFVLGPSSL